MVRIYTYNTPIPKGKHRLYLLALSLVGEPPKQLVASAHDGRRFVVDLATGMQTTVYFLGEYEKPVSTIVETLIQDNDCKVFLDAGANFGWYTSLFHKYAGGKGEVHAFEPVPSIFENLSRNWELMGCPQNVRINNLALGEAERVLAINLFAGLSSGHASISTQDRNDAIPFECRMVTLDSYIEDNKTEQVDFVKVDIEGAELGFLKGAERLFKQRKQPIWLIEMARNQTQNFGYFPNDLITFMKVRNDYRFYKIDELQESLIEIGGFSKSDIGANVICLPSGVEMLH